MSNACQILIYISNVIITFNNQFIIIITWMPVLYKQHFRQIPAQFQLLCGVPFRQNILTTFNLMLQRYSQFLPQFVTLSVLPGVYLLVSLSYLQIYIHAFSPPKQAHICFQPNKLHALPFHSLLFSYILVHLSASKIPLIQNIPNWSTNILRGIATTTDLATGFFYHVTEDHVHQIIFQNL